MHRFARPLTLCCAIALLCGCHRHDDTAAVPAAAAAKTQGRKPAPTPAATAPAHAGSAADKPAAADDQRFRVAGLTLGTAIDAGYAVTAPAVRFSSDTHTLYASVATDGSTRGARLDARWRYLEGKGVLVNALSQTIVADGPATTTFEVQNPNRWPTGKYVVEISLDGKLAAEQSFEVTDGK
ncbi:MAG: hypothetical protein RSP_01320 [Rhodanobacter sp.]